MAFLSLLVFISVIYLRPHEWVGILIGVPIMDIATVVTGVFLISQSIWTQRLNLRQSPNVLFSGFVLGLLLSLLVRGNVAGAREGFFHFLPNIILFFFIVNILISEKRIKIAVWVLIILTVILSIEGIQQYHRGYGWAMQTPYYAGRVARIRWIGIFHDPNILALVFIMGAGFLVSFLFGKTGYFTKLGSLAMLAVISVALYYTNSRGAYLALAASVAAYFLVRMKNKVKAVIIGSVMGFSVITIGPSRISQISATESSAQGRLEAWDVGFGMLRSNPLFGAGYRTFMDHHDRTAHNSFIQVAAETGLLGFFFWMGLIYMAFMGLGRVLRKEGIPKTYVESAFTGMFAFLAGAFFLSRAYTPPLYIVLALSAAIMYTFLEPEELRFRKKEIRNIALVTAGTLGVIWVSVHFSARVLG